MKFEGSPLLWKNDRSNAMRLERLFRSTISVRVSSGQAFRWSTEISSNCPYQWLEGYLCNWKFYIGSTRRALPIQMNSHLRTYLIKMFEDYKGYNNISGMAILSTGIMLAII